MEHSTRALPCMLLELEGLVLDNSGRAVGGGVHVHLPVLRTGVDVGAGHAGVAP